MDHTGLGMHYVNGFAIDSPVPTCLDILEGRAEFAGYKKLVVEKEPGVAFGYRYKLSLSFHLPHYHVPSGGGFIVLQHLMETMEGKTAEEVCRPFLDRSERFFIF